MNHLLRSVALSLSALTFLASAPCSAASLKYEFKLVDYPGAAVTQLWGINNLGVAVGQAFTADGTQFSFTYDTKKGTFTLLPKVPGAVNSGFFANNDFGTVVGFEDDNVTERGVILDKLGKFTSLVNPAWANTEARGVGLSGNVVGYSYDATGDNSVAFIYNPIFRKFTTFLPSSLTVAQGINTIGDVVGSVTTPNGRFGFVRSSGGGMTQFQVGGVATSPRGINDFGKVTGYVAGFVGFVGTLQGMSFQTFTVPGATRTVPESINNLGSIVGQTDSHGFVATPAALSLK